MESLETIIARAALAMDLAEEDLRTIFGQGEQKTYKAGDWLFHESTPRDWAGIIQDGEIEIVRGLNSVRLNFCMAVALSDTSGQYARSIQLPWPIH
jgi:CRP-like cAMP-binding protein